MKQTMGSGNGGAARQTLKRRVRGIAESLLYLAISVVVALTTGLAASLSKDHAVEIEIGVVIAAVVFAIEFMMSLLSNHRENALTLRVVKDCLADLKRHAAEADRRLDDIYNRASVISYGQQVEANSKFLNDRNDVIKRVGESALARCLGNFKRLNGGRGFEADGEDVGLYAYGKLWEELANQQIENQNHGKEPLIARVTHSTANHIWEMPALDKALAHQGRFCDAGGSIVRIFLTDPEPIGEGLSKIIVRMKKFGIHVFEIEKKKIGGFYSDDFLWVGGYWVKWIAGQSKEVLLKVQVSEMTDDALDRLRTEWGHIAKVVIDKYTVSPNKISEEATRILSEFSD
jgi:hypothetical protein